MEGPRLSQQAHTGHPGTQFEKGDAAVRTHGPQDYSPAWEQVSYKGHGISILGKSPNVAG